MNFSSIEAIIKCAQPINHRLEITERQNRSDESRLHTVFINTENNSAIKLCFDGTKPVSNHLLDGKHQKACDAVIIATVNDKNYLIFVEMKSNSFDTNKIILQFKSSECFLDYCNSILKHMYNNSITDTLEKRFVVFCLEKKQNLPKTTTRQTPSNQTKFPLHDQPENARYYTCNENKKIFKIKTLLTPNGPTVLT